MEVGKEVPNLIRKTKSKLVIYIDIWVQAHLNGSWKGNTQPYLEKYLEEHKGGDGFPLFLPSPFFPFGVRSFAQISKRQKRC
jgi:hypothetical protein